MIFETTAVLVWFFAFNFFLLLGLGWMDDEFHDLGGFHNSSTMLLEFWWFKGFLKGLVILGKTTVLALFFAFDCFCRFWVKDGSFMDFVILVGFTAFP